jgi:hypothetical protein
MDLNDLKNIDTDGEFQFRKGLSRSAGARERPTLPWNQEFTGSWYCARGLINP